LIPIIFPSHPLLMTQALLYLPNSKKDIPFPDPKIWMRTISLSKNFRNILKQQGSSSSMFIFWMNWTVYLMMWWDFLFLYSSQRFFKLSKMVFWQTLSFPFDLFCDWWEAFLAINGSIFYDKVKSWLCWWQSNDAQNKLIDLTHEKDI